MEDLKLELIKCAETSTYTIKDETTLLKFSFI